MRPLVSCRAALGANPGRVSRAALGANARRISLRPLVTLAIETSCDDTAVAVLSRADSSEADPRATSAKLLFNRRISSDNRPFGGVNPKVAVESHNARLAPLVREAISVLPSSRPDFVSVTRGPGIAANLAVGLNVAKGLCAAWDVPLLAVHHMQAHALTPRLVTALLNPSSSSSSSAPSAPSFPFLSLLVSGGHTQLLLSASPTAHRVIATTADIAVGNMLDQTARVILPRECLDASPDVMYGRALEAFAFPDANQENNPAQYSFFRPAKSRHAEMFPEHDGLPLPFKDSRKLAFSFSSIHSRVHAIAAAKPHMSMDDRRLLARHTLRAAFQHLVSRLVLALEDSPLLADCRDSISTLVVAGGVASNSFLMHVLRATLDVRGFAHLDIVRPPVALCTDNAAMIAWTGMEMYDAGWRSDLSVLPIAKWPMDGKGIMGVDGWSKM